jgi:mono/diheme cytochrome c family protein
MMPSVSRRKFMGFLQQRVAVAIGLLATTIAVAQLQQTAAVAPAADAVATTTPGDSNRHGKQPAQIDFNRDVIPILSANCFKCHGPDPDNRKAGLRLDRREIAIKPAESGAIAIVPGKPDGSELVRRIFSGDPDERMPPKESNKVLSDSQKQMLRRWIAEGAEYQPHWSLVPPRQAPLPSVKRVNWAKNPLDYFVLAKLEAEGLNPSPEADRYTLVRRLYLDLIGLPPTPEEADAFLHDSAPNAYERLVDKLLNSPHYGERWARRWLDLARYADTNGYEKDRPRSIWPYRDWVIRALNADMPFDEFTIEQLAGDMLPGADSEQRTATGFHRNTMRNEEGGIDPLEFRYYSIVDRINTTGSVWLGLTVGCAQCHTHKFDPLTNREYYQLMAFLDNADEPEIPLPDGRILAKRKEIDGRIAKLTAELPDHFPVEEIRSWNVPEATITAASRCTVESGGDGSWRFTGLAADRDTYTLSFDATSNVDSIRLEALKDGGKSGPGRTPHGNFVLSEISASLTPLGGEGKSVPVKFVRAEADFSQKGWPVAAAIDGNLATGWGIATDDGSPVKEHSATFYLAKPAGIPHGSRCRWTVKLEQQFGGRHTIGRLRLSVGSPPAQRTPEEIAEQRHKAFDRAFAEWTKHAAERATHWSVLRPAEMRSSSPTLTLLDDNSVLAGGDLTKSDTYDVVFGPHPRGVTAVLLEALPDESLPQHGPGMIYYEGPFGDFFLSEIQCFIGGKEQKFARAEQSYSAPGFEASHAIDGDPQTGWMITGGQGKPHYAVFRLAHPTNAAGKLRIHMLFERYYAAALGHFRISVSADAHAGESVPLPPEIEQTLLTPAENRSPQQRSALLAQFLSVAPELAGPRKEIEQLRGQIPVPPTTLVMLQRPANHSRTTRVHHRGEFLQPREAVEAGVPAFLPPLPSGAPRNRLTFARWLVSADNPLTARVTVNRQWAALFGQGIVRTLGDFGYQGSLPSNAALLDWLAVELVKQKWSLKSITRLIVTSATYRQSSRVSPELLARDPNNVLLARGSRFRLDAEILRDAALKSAGLLSEKLGGPSVFPPQPASVTTEGSYGSLAWTTSSGEDRYRRSLYTFSKRTSPFAMYNTFDAPSGEACLVRREVSNSPLQGLTLLNDTVFLEAAQALGKLAVESGGTDASRATLLFRRCLTRPPQRDELAQLTAFASKERLRLAKNGAAARQLAGADKQAVDRATWTAVARALLNLDETVTRN